MADIVFPGQSAGAALNSDSLPANSDLVIYKGDHVRLNVFVTEGGQPVDLTGATAKAQLKSDYTDRSPKEFVCTVIDALTGEVEIFLPSTITSELLPGSYIWDFQITFSAEETRTYFAGDVTVYNEVTT